MAVFRLDPPECELASVAARARLSGPPHFLSDHGRLLEKGTQRAQRLVDGEVAACAAYGLET
jgi:hypothetical protein